MAAAPQQLTATPVVGLALAVVLAASTTTAAAWPSAPLPAVPPAAAAAPPAPDAPPAPVAVSAGVVGLASPLVELGLHPDGTLQVPADPALAGWYTGAARPGQPGPVVVVGHVDSYQGPGVFARLGELVPGDRVELATADGGVAVYEVTGARTVPKDAFPTQEVYGRVAADELRLITCGGEFDRSARSYRDNVVVTAVRA